MARRALINHFQAATAVSLSADLDNPEVDENSVVKSGLGKPELKSLTTDNRSSCPSRNSETAEKASFRSWKEKRERRRKFGKALKWFRD